MSFVGINRAVPDCTPWQLCDGIYGEIEGASKGLALLHDLPPCIAGGLSRSLDGLEHDLLPVSIAMDAMRIGSAVLADNGHVGKNTVHAVSGAAGGWVGAWVGGATGAHCGELLGASIGTVLGGIPGTVAGASVGGAIGFIGGSIYGGVTAAKLAETFTSRATLYG